jgi:hypothetical protein
VSKLKLKIFDYVIVGLILLWGLAGFWFNLQDVSATERKYAVIYVKNQQVAEISLSRDDQFSHEIQFGDDNEHSALIEVDNGRIRMLPLDEELCPKAICSHTGWIAYSYESIVCLPNQIMIVFNETATGGDTGDIDGITF